MRPKRLAQFDPKYPESKQNSKSAICVILLIPNLLRDQMAVKTFNFDILPIIIINGHFLNMII
jgi:hypothetical protein